MDKIIFKNNKNKGLTLIELLIYMSIFSIILLMINSSVFYLQKIIQNNNRNYYIKNQIYLNLNMLQQYLYRDYVTVDNKGLNIFNKNNDLIMTQSLENNRIKNVYKNKWFYIVDNVYLQKYNISLIDDNSLLKVEVLWNDDRGKSQNLTQYLIVINQNM